MEGDMEQLHVVHVGRAGEIQNSRAAMRPPVIMPLRAVAGVGVVEAEAVALIVGQALVREDLVEDAHHRGIVK